MKSSLIILAFFVAGVLGGFSSKMPVGLAQPEAAMLAVYLLLFLVGITVGGNPNTWHILRTVNFKILLVPCATMIGTFAGVLLVKPLLPNLEVQEVLAVGAGFGYYSLSSVLIRQISGETLSVIALLANVMREILTLLFAPLLVRYFGKLAPIASGGATALDTTLPIIAHFSGANYAVIAVFSALVLTISVPLLVLFFLNY